MKNSLIKMEDKISKMFYPDRLTRADLKKYKEICEVGMAIRGIKAHRKNSVDTKIGQINTVIPKLKIKEKVDKEKEDNMLAGFTDEQALTAALLDYSEEIRKACDIYAEYKRNKYGEGYTMKGTKNNLEARGKIPDQSEFKKRRSPKSLFSSISDISSKKSSSKKSSSKKSS